MYTELCQPGQSLSHTHNSPIHIFGNADNAALSYDMSNHIAKGVLFMERMKSICNRSHFVEQAAIPQKQAPLFPFLN